MSVCESIAKFIFVPSHGASRSTECVSVCVRVVVDGRNAFNFTHSAHIPDAEEQPYDVERANGMGDVLCNRVQQLLLRSLAWNRCLCSRYEVRVLRKMVCKIIFVLDGCSRFAFGFSHLRSAFFYPLAHACCPSCRASFPN